MASSALSSVQRKDHAHHDIRHDKAPVQYLRGFHNEHSSEAIQGALPVGQNSPQKVCEKGVQHTPF